MNDINTNMVPFPRMQFLASAYSPITVCSARSERKTKKYPVVLIINGNLLNISCFRQIKDDLFLSVCSRNNELLKINSTGI